MSDTATESSARESRFKAKESQQVRVTVERTVEGVAERRDAQLLDLSPSGARVLLSEPPKFQEAILLGIESPELNLELRISAVVNWLRPATNERWTVGCSFLPPMPERCIQDLFKKGLLERRRARRRTISGAAIAHWELDPQPLPVSMVDMSSGGFAVLSPNSATTNTRMLLTVGANPDQRVEIPAKVRWQLQVAEGFIVGCEFVTPNGYTQLREAVPPAEPEWAFKLPEKGLSILSLAGIAAIVAWYCFFVLAQ